MDATAEHSPPRRPPGAISRRRALSLAGLLGVGAAGSLLVRPAWDRLGLDAASASSPTATPTSSTTTSTTSTVPTATAATPAVASLPAPSGVAVLGDSITYMSDGALRSAIAPVASFSSVGRVGYTIEQLLPDAEAAALTVPAAVVINLGTNDALNAVASSASVTSLDSMLALFPSSTPVLVTVSTHFGDAACVARAKAINAHIRRLGVAVADWNAHVGQEIAAGLPHGAITTDDVHPTARGQRVLANLIAAALPASVYTA